MNPATSFCAATHPGVRRTANEDGYCARPDLGLFAVADGVGGYAAGEIASRVALAALEEAVAETGGLSATDRWPFEFQPALGVNGNRLNWGFHQANARVRAEMRTVRGRTGMATTLAAVLLEPGEDGALRAARGATVAHIGDSRIYRWRAGRLDPLTRDHSWVQEQIDAGLLAAQDGRAHPRRHLLTRAVTGGADAAGDIGRVLVAKGDRLLLCTDGLTTVVSDGDIASMVGADFGDGEGTTACDALVHAANLAGGPDNVTVIVVRL